MFLPRAPRTAQGSRPFHLETIRIGIPGILIEIHIDLQVQLCSLDHFGTLCNQCSCDSYVFMLAPDDRSICLSSSCMEPRWKDDRNAVKPQTFPQTSRSEESRDPYAGSSLTMLHNASRCLKGLVRGCAWFCLVGTANAWSETVFQCTFYVFLPHKGFF